MGCIYAYAKRNKSISLQGFVSKANNVITATSKQIPGKITKFNYQTSLYSNKNPRGNRIISGKEKKLAWWCIQICRS